MNRPAEVLEGTRYLAFADMLRHSLLIEPEREAFRHNGQRLSRGELLTHASALADELTSARLQPGEPVVVDLPHGLALCVAMVAIPLAGGCVVPLDAALPHARRKAILQDIDARLQLVEDAGGGTVPTIRVREDVEHDQLQDPDLLFLVYTSGSTGGPKGVKVSHTNYASRMVQILPTDPPCSTEVDLCWTPASFIGMLDEVYYPLLSKKRSVIASPEIRLDLRRLAALIEAEAVTSFRVTASLLSVLLNAGLAPCLASVRDIYCSGEAVPDALVTKVQKSMDARLWCFYGATEAPGIAYCEASAGTQSEGAAFYAPQSFVDLRIATPGGAPSDTGEEGEIWVGGDVVSTGYWKNEELTEEKFRFDGETWWYRTGDIGRARADGRFEILGRSDLSECKINGVRISLEEIRVALSDLPGVEAAWVSILEPAGNAGQVQLVGHACAAAGSAVLPEDIMTALSARLASPTFLSSVMIHDSFPLTTNGKLDVQAMIRLSRDHLDAISADTLSSATETPDVKPEVQSVVVALAKQVLETNALSGKDNFFRAGGTSLSAVEFAIRLSDRVGHEVASTVVFNANTLDDIALSIQNDDARATFALRPLREGTSENAHLFTINSTGNYARLANALNPRLNIHNLNIYGLALALESRLEHLDLNDIAELFADELIALAPAGPWPLLAYCQDGCLAVETARVLKQRTGHAAHLLLIDTFFTDHRKTLTMYLDNARSMEIGALLAKLANRVPPRRGKRQTASQRKGAVTGKSNKSKLDGRLNARFRELYMPYEPAPLEVPATLFVSREWRHVSLNAVRNMAAAGLSVQEVAGTHHSLFRAECISSLGTALNQELVSIGVL